jgi:hypothetical protein
LRLGAFAFKNAAISEKAGPASQAVRGGGLGRHHGELTRRSKGDKQKINMARRLRVERMMSLAWIAGRLHMGS